MKLFRTAAIQNKLTFVIVCTSIVGLSLACISFDLYERSSFRGAMTSELSALAETLGANTAAALTFADRKSAQDILGALRAEEHVIGARLYDSQGLLFAEYRRHGSSLDLAVPAVQQDREHFEQD